MARQRSVLLTNSWISGRRSHVCLNEQACARANKHESPQFTRSTGYQLVPGTDNWIHGAGLVALKPGAPTLTVLRCSLTGVSQLFIRDFVRKSPKPACFAERKA